MKECPVCRRCFSDSVNHCPTDGGSLKFTLMGDTTLDGRYSLEQRLGQGGMGAVFKARHIFLKTSHAIKIILPDLVGNDPSLATRFRQEAMAAAAIHHPNIVAVTDFGIINGSMPFLVMEYIQGRSLQEIIAEEGRLSPKRAVEIMTAVAAGVEAAHRQGIVHRDLKPLNIMIKESVAPSEGVKVLDFGLAKIKSTELLGSFVAAQTTGMMGSPFYMAPEQWGDDEPNRQADIYSLGVILYQMLAGDVPFKGASIPSIMNKHLTSAPPSLSSRGVEVPPALEGAILHALEKDPEQRPRTVAEFIDELRAAVSDQATAPLHPVGFETVSIASLDTIAQPQPLDERRASTTSTEIAPETRIEDFALGNVTRRETDNNASTGVHHEAPTDLLPVAPPAQQPLGGETAQRQGSVTTPLALDTSAGQPRLQPDTAALPNTEEQPAPVALVGPEAPVAPVEHEASLPPPRELESHDNGASVITQVAIKPQEVAVPPEVVRPRETPSHTPTPVPDAAHAPSRAPFIVLAVVLFFVLLGGIIGGVYVWKSREVAGSSGPVDNPPPAPSGPIVGPNAPPPGSNFKPELVALPGGTFEVGRAVVPQASGAPTPLLTWLYSQWPAHPVSIKPFSIDRTEVTNAEYAEFVNQTGYPPPPDWSGKRPAAGQEMWPVRNVSYEDAVRFAQWRSKRDGVTYRLPTEEEWEYAARGGDASRLFPWGGEWVAGRANVGAETLKPVGSFPEGQTPQGLLDMIGSVWEWTSSEASVYKGSNVTLSPNDKGKLVVRGGSFQSSGEGSQPVSATARMWISKEKRDPTLGFRLVREGS